MVYQLLAKGFLQPNKTSKPTKINMSSGNTHPSYSVPSFLLHQSLSLRDITRGGIKLSLCTLDKPPQGQWNWSSWSSFGLTTFQRSSNQYSKVLRPHRLCMRKNVIKCVLTAHLHAESCFLTVQLKNFFHTACKTNSSCVASVKSRTTLESCFRHPCSMNSCVSMLVSLHILS